MGDAIREYGLNEPMNSPSGSAVVLSSGQTATLWRSLGEALAERVPFEPALRHEIVRQLVADWIQEPTIEGETAALLRKLSDPAFVLTEVLTDVLQSAEREVEPKLALEVLRLRVRLLGWPTADVREADRLARAVRSHLIARGSVGIPQSLWQRAADLLMEADPTRVSQQPEGRRCVQWVRQWWQTRMSNPELSFYDRAHAGVMVGGLGDVRTGVGTRPGKMLLPDFVWCGPGGELAEPRDFSHAFPAKRFMMGGDPEAFGCFPQALACTRLRARFFVAKFPVTGAQYQTFVEGGGYGEPGQPKPPWWSDAGWAWLAGRSAPRPWPEWLRAEYQKAVFPIRGPKVYLPVFQTPNHPQVGVSWYEAHAFCGWLRSPEILPQLGLPKHAEIRLPTEAEWELVSRWNQALNQVDGRPFPWTSAGQPLPDDDGFSERCNWGKAGLGHTSAVGLFTAGQADCGATDLAGNVWEWCQSKWIKSGDHWSAKDYNDLQNGLDDDEGEEDRVLRGGSWHYAHPAALRAAIRYFSPPAGRISSIGFRVVCRVAATG